MVHSFNVEKVLSDGHILKFATGCWCLKCGCTCEVFPLSTPEELFDMCNNNASFRREVTLAAAGVVASMRKWKLRNITVNDAIGLRTYADVILVQVDVWTTHMQVTPAPIKTAKCVDVVCPELGEQECVITHAGTVPDDVLLKMPHFKAQLYADKHVKLEDLVTSSHLW